jgi:hypothetical protein
MWERELRFKKLGLTSRSASTRAPGKGKKVEVVLLSEGVAKWFLGRVGLVQAMGVCDEALLAVAALARSLALRTCQILEGVYS